MAWWMIPLAMAGMGAIKGNKQRNQEIENNRLEAELTKYAPWTGKWGEISPVMSSGLDGFMQGGMSGLGLSQNMIGAGMMNGPKAAKTLDVPSTTEVSSGWASVGEADARDEALSREYRRRNLRGGW